MELLEVEPGFINLDFEVESNSTSSPLTVGGVSSEEEVWFGAWFSPPAVDL
jgi:hypothetical protein